MSVETELPEAKGTPAWPARPPVFAEIAPPDRLLVPLSAREEATDKLKPPGTFVTRGEALLDYGEESAHVALAPLDGTLGEAIQTTLSNGRSAWAVELRVHTDAARDKSQTGARESPGETDHRSLVHWIDFLRHCGVSADRQASPDLIGQLNQVVSRPIDCVICTALDSDASLRLNAAIAALNAQTIAAGVALLAKITGARRAVVAIEEFSGSAWATPIRAAVRAAKLDIADLANDYPQSDPSLMVYTLTKRRLRPGNLPTTQAVLVLDAAAALALGRAARGRAAISTPLAIHDHLRRLSYFVEVPIGTPLRHVMQTLRITSDRVVLRGGDLLRDVRVSGEVPIGGGELTIHVTAAETPVNPEPCIRCGWCGDACPTLVQPAVVLEAVQRRDRHMAQRAGIGACIECGLCSHVCPSELPLLESIRHLRGLVARGEELDQWIR